MSVTEQQRRLLFDRLSEAIGDEATNVMAELLPFHPSTELVTRSDLAATTTMLRGEMAELRGELKADIGNLYRWGAGVMVANGVAVVTALIT